MVTPKPVSVMLGTQGDALKWLLAEYSSLELATRISNCISSIRAHCLPNYKIISGLMQTIQKIMKSMTEKESTLFPPPQDNDYPHLAIVLSSLFSIPPCKRDWHKQNQSMDTVLSQEMGRAGKMHLKNPLQRLDLQSFRQVIPDGDTPLAQEEADQPRDLCIPHRDHWAIASLRLPLLLPHPVPASWEMKPFLSLESRD